MISLPEAVRPAVEEVRYSPPTWFFVLGLAVFGWIEWEALGDVRILEGRSVGSIVMSALIFLVVWRSARGSSRLLPARDVSSVERSGKRLLERIVRKEPADEEQQTIREVAEEGNTDAEHLRATLWLSLSARYRGDLATEIEAMDLIDRRVDAAYRHGTLEFLWPEYEAWYLRAEVALRQDPDLLQLLPPKLPPPGGLGR